MAIVCWCLTGWIQGDISEIQPCPFNPKTEFKLALENRSWRGADVYAGSLQENRRKPNRAIGRPGGRGKEARTPAFAKFESLSRAGTRISANSWMSPASRSVASAVSAVFIPPGGATVNRP